jgi:oligopeptide/dipeptide ABC transporter ATP-binding protein
MNQQDNWLLRVDDLSVHFGTSKGVAHAVDHVSFDIYPHETLALVGETGCGKSVTARSILRLVPEPPGKYASGSIILRNGDGTTTDILTAPTKTVRGIRGDRISMIFQDPGKALNPGLTIGRQLAEVFGEHRMGMILGNAGLNSDKPSRTATKIVQQRASVLERRIFELTQPKVSKAVQKSIDDSVMSALADTGIPNPRKIMGSYPHELSGGMKQRVMIAQALACDPDLLIADEPTTALDVTIQARILELIHQMQQRRGMAILYITHDLSLVREVADRVAVMYAGRIAEIGPAQEVLASPQHPYTQGLLAAIPRPATPRGELAAIPGTVPQLISPPAQCHFASRCQFASAACRGHVPGLLSIEKGREVACLRFDTPEHVGVAATDMPVAADKKGVPAS